MEIIASRVLAAETALSGTTSYEMKFIFSDTALDSTQKWRDQASCSQDLLLAATKRMVLIELQRTFIDLLMSTCRDGGEELQQL